MYKFEKSVVINRPQQHVFNYVSDASKIDQWQSGVESSQWTSDGTPDVGSTFKVVRSFLGRKIDSELEITAYDPPSRMSFKTISGPVPAEVTTIFEEQGEATSLTVKSQAEVGGFFKLAEGLAGRQFEKQVDSDLKNLKHLLEEG